MIDLNKYIAVVTATDADLCEFIPADECAKYDCRHCPFNYSDVIYSSKEEDDNE